MDRYEVTLTGLTPMLMHQDNLNFAEKVSAWRKDPANKSMSTAGDDRSPAWTWIGCLYHDTRHLGMPSDNLMTMLREGGAKVKTGQGKETYKKQTQAGIMIDQQQWTLYVNGEMKSIEPFEKLIGNNDFARHLDVVQENGFDLLVKRAKIGNSKHVRVRPIFRNWVVQGSLTVLDSEVSGITQEILQLILNQSGALCGLGDWRPNSPKSSGTFGRFEPTVTKIS